MRDLYQRKIKVFIDALDEASSKLCWGTTIQADPIERNEKRSITLAGSLLTETSIVATAKVKESTEQIWDSTSRGHAIDKDKTAPIELQERVTLSMMSVRLKGSIDASVKQKLCLKSEFLRRHNQGDASHEDDRSTVAHLPFDIADPTTNTGASNLKVS